jgi:hypothetical protein
MMCEIDLLQGNVEETYESYDNFQHILRELESVRQEAYEEKCRREKAERELFEALQKVIILIYSYHSHCTHNILEDLIDLHCCLLARLIPE